MKVNLFFRLKGREERERMLGVGDDYQDLFGGDDDQEYIDSKFTNQQIQVLVWLALLSPLFSCCRSSSIISLSTE